MVSTMHPNRGISTLITTVAISAALLIFAGCDTTVDSIIEGDSPTNVSATKGDYDNRIEISWTAPNPPEGEGGEVNPELIGYDVIRTYTDPDTDTETVVALSGDLLGTEMTEYVDSRSSLQQGVRYDYEIQAVYSDGTRRNSISTPGYTITASEISVGSTLSRYTRTYDTTREPVSADGKVWFRLLVQRGWNYQVLADSDTTATTVRFLHEGRLSEVISSDPDADSGALTFTAEQSGDYFVELSGGSGSVSVRYLGAE